MAVGVLIAATPVAVACGGDGPLPAFSVPPTISGPSAPMPPGQPEGEISAPAETPPEFVPGPQPTEPDAPVVVPTTPTMTPTEPPPPSPEPEPPWPLPTPFPTAGSDGG